MTVEYIVEISEENIRGKNEFIVMPLVSLDVYGPTFPVYW